MDNRGVCGALGGWFAEAGDAVASLFFPAPCRLCEKLLTRASRVPICADCLASFAVMPRDVCQICGAAPEAPVLREGAEQEPAPSLEFEPRVCGICRIRPYRFDRARSYAVYAGDLVRAIVMLKFEQIEPLGGWFARRLLTVVQREAGKLQADVVVPVPLHRERQRERGYNQADLIAKPLAKCLGLPYRAVLPDAHAPTAG